MGKIHTYFPSKYAYWENKLCLQETTTKSMLEKQKKALFFFPELGMINNNSYQLPSVYSVIRMLNLLAWVDVVISALEMIK